MLAFQNIGPCNDAIDAFDVVYALALLVNSALTVYLTRGIRATRAELAKRENGLRGSRSGVERRKPETPLTQGRIDDGPPQKERPR